MEEILLYKIIIKNIISQAQDGKIHIDNNITYNELKNWLKISKINLSNEIFKAVLAASRSAANDILNGNDPDLKYIAEKTAMSYHTFTGKDKIHTDPGIILDYLEMFYPTLLSKINSIKYLGNDELRSRCVDVCNIEKLFDKILEKVSDENRNDVINLMDNFMLNDLK